MGNKSPNSQLEQNSEGNQNNSGINTPKFNQEEHSNDESDENNTKLKINKRKIISQIPYMGLSKNSVVIEDNPLTKQIDDYAYNLAHYNPEDNINDFYSSITPMKTRPQKFWGQEGYRNYLTLTMNNDYEDKNHRSSNYSAVCIQKKAMKEHMFPTVVIKEEEKGSIKRLNDEELEEALDFCIDIDKYELRPRLGLLAPINLDSKEKKSIIKDESIEQSEFIMEEGDLEVFKEAKNKIIIDETIDIKPEAKKIDSPKAKKETVKLHEFKRYPKQITKQQMLERQKEIRKQQMIKMNLARKKGVVLSKETQEQMLRRKQIMMKQEMMKRQSIEARQEILKRQMQNKTPNPSHKNEVSAQQFNNARLRQQSVKRVHAINNFDINKQPMTTQQLNKQQIAKLQLAKTQQMVRPQPISNQQLSKQQIMMKQQLTKQQLMAKQPMTQQQLALRKQMIAKKQAMEREEALRKINEIA